MQAPPTQARDRAGCEWPVSHVARLFATFTYRPRAKGRERDLRKVPGAGTVEGISAANAERSPSERRQ